MFKKLQLKLLNSLGLLDNISKKPKSLLIYYGYPSLINHAKTNSEAVDSFKEYDYLILGDGLSDKNHDDYLNTIEILSADGMQNTKIFGYIDAGITTQGLLISKIKAIIEEWKSMGVYGVFLDDFGFDFGVSRERQNQIIDYAHEQDLKVIVNGWNPDDIFEVSDELEASTLNQNDFYFMESYQICLSDYNMLTQWREKSKKVKSYQNKIGFKIVSTTTSKNQSLYDENKFFYAWYSAFFDEHEAISWGEENFGATTQEIPFRKRPELKENLCFTSKIKYKNDIVMRETTIGKIKIDSLNHKVSFDK